MAVAAAAVTVLAACSSGSQASSSSTASAPAAAATRTFTSRPYHFSFSYDPDRLSPSRSPYPLETFNVFFSPKGDHGEMILLAYRGRRPVTSAGLRQWLTRVVRSYAPDSEPRRITATEVGGLPAFVSTSVAGGTLRTVTYVCGRGRYAYLFSLQGDRHRWPELKPAYLQVVRSFQVVE